MSPLTAVKLLHTVIWAVMAASTVYIFYCGLVGRLTWLMWAALILMLGESVVIWLNKWICPLTPIAARYTENREPNFDIYLPRWLAKYNKQIFGTILVLGLVLVGWRLVS